MHAYEKIFDLTNQHKVKMKIEPTNDKERPL